MEEAQGLCTGAVPQSHAVPRATPPPLAPPPLARTFHSFLRLSVSGRVRQSTEAELEQSGSQVGAGRLLG